jgi:Zn-dependent alcohol dehydrogenase
MAAFEPGLHRHRDEAYRHHRYLALDQINEGFDLMKKSESIRSVVLY